MIEFPMNRFIYLIASFFIVILEIILCFKGPMALMTTPSLMVTPIYNVGGSEIEVERTFKKVEQLAAKTGSFNVLSKQRLEDYFIGKGEGEMGFTYSKNLNYREYIDIGNKLGIERIMLSILSVGRSKVQLIVITRDVKSGEIVNKKTFSSNTFNNLLNNKGINGSDLNMVNELTIGTNGISLFDKLFFILIGCQILYTLLFLTNREKRIYEEIIMSFSIMMFLFAFIYALNANMSYVQLFIAQMGEIGMAESTQLEQLFASIRFLPFIIINLVVYIKRGVPKSGAGSLKDIVKTWGLPITLLSTFLFSISFPSFLNLDGISILAWFSLVPLFILIQNSSKRAGIFYLIIFGGVQSIIINYWHGTFKLIALPFSSIVTILIYTPFAVLLVYMIRINRRFNFLIIPGLWVVFDFLRSSGFTGYPWGIIGTTQYKFIYFNQFASITGIWGLSFVILLCNSAIAQLILNYKKTGFLLGIKTFIPVFLTVLLYGGISTSILDRESPIDRVKISLIQQNSDPRRHDFYKTFESLKRLTDSSIESWGRTPDLVVWSEGAFKKDIRFLSKVVSSNSLASNEIVKLKEFIKNRGIWLLTGSQDHEIITTKEGEEMRLNYNSAVYLNPNGDVVDVYHKIHLVPFSEYFPYKDELPFIAGLLERFNTSNWSQGKRRFSFNHPDFAFSTPICFEDVFSSELREFVHKGSDVFVNISNDFWAMTPVEAKQHGVNALFRTIENRRAMVRSTCSGYTVHFDRLGRIVDEAEGYYIESFVNADVPIYEKRATFYNKYGDWFPLSLFILIILKVIWVGAINAKSRKKVKI